MSKKSFKAVIAGGGIAGLTLANCLQDANIDFVLLEARDQIAPQVGASIGIGPNGGRILDQIGVYDKILECVEPLNYFNYWKDKKRICRDDGAQLARTRTGYPIIFLDRQKVLQILYDNLRHKSKVLLNKRVTQVDHSAKGVIVSCKDGSKYDGDIIAGADGVHSVVRQEMWRNADLVEPGCIPQKDKNQMIAEYSCLFGISNRVDGPVIGELERVYAKDTSALLITGKGGRIFWFFFKKLDKTYRVPDIPKFTKQDADRLANDNLDYPLTDSVNFGDVWKQRVSYALVPLEEAFFETWAWGRFANLGDSIHKMTPNVGQGGNSAIESAAALANSLNRVLKKTGSTHPSYDDVKETLIGFQRKREVRTKAIVVGCNKFTRLEALKGPIERLTMLYIAPNAGDYFSNLGSHTCVGAEKVEYLPDPERSFQATLPFNPNYGQGKEESRLRRILFALPLIILGYCCYTILSSIPSSQVFLSQWPLKNGELNFGDGKTYEFWDSYYWGISLLDEIFKPIIVLFSPSLLDIDPAQRLQMVSFLTDLAPLYLVWVFESYRRTNQLTFARLPVIFGTLFQFYGIGSIGPIYYALHYIQSPIEKYLGSDLRLINVAYSKTALPAVFIAYLLPHFLMYFYPSPSVRLQANAIWQIFPVLVPLTQWLLTSLFVTDTTQTARLHNTTADLKHIRFAIFTSILIAGLTFNYVRFSSPDPLSGIFIPSSSFFLAPLEYAKALGFLPGMALLLQVDHLSCFTASFVWLAMLFKDLKGADMLRVGWVKILCIAAAATVLAGPGVAVAAGWLWREEILVRRRAKGAVVRKAE